MTQLACYVRPAQLFLFNQLTLDEAIELAPRSKQVWLNTIHIAITACHGSLKILQTQMPSMRDYFSPVS
jgi:hypothetical protein